MDEKKSNRVDGHEEMKAPLDSRDAFDAGESFAAPGAGMGEQGGAKSGHEAAADRVERRRIDESLAAMPVHDSSSTAEDVSPDSDFVHPADVAEELSDLPLEEQVSRIQSLPLEDAAAALAEMEGDDQVEILENIDSDLAAQIVSEMSPDDAADVLDELEEEHRDELLNNLETEDADELRRLMGFDPDTAGGIMNTEVVILEENLTVDEAIQQIRREIEDKELPYYAFVVDSSEHLIGVLSLRDLLTAKPGTLLHDALRNRNVISVPSDADKLEVAQLLSHYNFMAIPVVDKENHLLGVVTYDDVIDVINDSASEDMLGMVGAGVDENIDTPWYESVKMRLPWLIINILNSTISASVVYMFEGTIAQMAILAVLMPIVANQAGNTGQQALAVMIRQLATDSFEPRRMWLAVLREGCIGFTNGLMVGFITFIAVYIFMGNAILAAVMGGAMVSDMSLGAMAGASIPLILKSFGRDPAQASSIFLTMLTDSGGFFIFLGLASLFLL